MELSIKRKKETSVKSSDYEIKLNNQVLGKGVTKINLLMVANEKPKLTIECDLDQVDIEKVLVNKEIIPLDTDESNLTELNGA